MRQRFSFATCGSPPPPPPRASPPHCIRGRRRMRIRGSGGASRSEIQEGKGGTPGVNLWPAATKRTDAFPSRDRRVQGTRSGQRKKKHRKCKYSNLVSASQIGQAPFRIGKDGENGEILAAQRTTEAYLSSTIPIEQFPFFSEYPCRKDQFCSFSWPKNVSNDRENSLFIRLNAWN